VARFIQADYAGAAGEFRKALEADGSRIEAKRNLELSLVSISNQANQETAASALPLDWVEGDKGPDILYDYIRRKEQEQWKSQEWVEEILSPGPDY
jgi:Ca-activated chloride channel family protein